MRCCFCKKDLDKENFIGDIRGGLGNKLLAVLCKECYDKLTKINHNENIVNLANEGNLTHTEL